MGDVLNRFPVLVGYQTLLYVLAGILLFVGLFIAYDAGKSEWGDGFSWENAIRSYINLGAISLGLVVTAELIQLGLAIEDHLYNIRSQMSSNTHAASTQRNQTSQLSEVTAKPASLPRPRRTGPAYKRLGKFDPPPEH